MVCLKIVANIFFIALVWTLCISAGMFTWLMVMSMPIKYKAAILSVSLVLICVGGGFTTMELVKNCRAILLERSHEASSPTFV